MNRYEAFPNLDRAGERHREHLVPRVVLLSAGAAILLACATGAALYFQAQGLKKPQVDVWGTLQAIGAPPQGATAAALADASRHPQQPVRHPSVPVATTPVTLVEAAKLVDKAERPSLTPDKTSAADTLPSLTVAPQITATAHATTALALTINRDGVLAEGSQIVIQGLPEGTILSAGHAAENGAWLLTPDELAGLTITPGNSTTAPVDLVIQIKDAGYVTHEARTELKVAAAPSSQSATAFVDEAATPDEMRAWMTHGRDLERVGYLAGARLFYQHAAEAGSAEGAEALAKTYDPAEFQRLGVHGMTPDPALAQKWYARAKVLDDRQAMTQSGKLQ